ncbi:MAG: hypothetical protein DHS20C08_16910 [Rhodomicrobium sp.]|nr:MAG: hypothetical protein DHS20C08_16910 [Rhodomicrobium sp.]
MTTGKKGKIDDHAVESAREYAKQNITRVKDAQEQFLSAMTQAQAMFIKSTAMVGNDDVSDLNQKTLDYVRENINSSYELATKLVDATDMSQAMELQSEYVRKQIEAYTEQAQELSSMVTKDHK